MKLGSKMSAKSRTKMAVAKLGNQHAWKGGLGGYTTVHGLAREALADQPCAHQDESCLGRLEVAFSHDTPAEFVKVDPGGKWPYSVRVEDYQRLCRSHHVRYDRKTE